MPIPRRDRHARTLLVAGAFVLLAGSAPESTAATAPPCVPVPDAGPRDSDAYRDPEPVPS